MITAKQPEKQKVKENDGSTYVIPNSNTLIDTHGEPIHLTEEKYLLKHSNEDEFCIFVNGKNRFFSPKDFRLA